MHHMKSDIVSEFATIKQCIVDTKHRTNTPPYFFTHSSQPIDCLTVLGCQLYYCQ